MAAIGAVCRLVRIYAATNEFFRGENVVAGHYFNIGGAGRINLLTNAVKSGILT